MSMRSLPVLPPGQPSHLARSAARLLPARGTVAGYDASGVVAVKERIPRSGSRTPGEPGSDTQPLKLDTATL